MPQIQVRHNMEMAHRLYDSPGKCQQIHGHSWWVELTIEGELTPEGLAGGMDFGDIKKVFRHYLDTTYDHRVLLNKKDPFAGRIFFLGQEPIEGDKLPGLQTFTVDPTTEHIAQNIYLWAAAEFDSSRAHVVGVRVQETSVNSARWP